MKKNGWRLLVLTAAIAAALVLGGMAGTADRSAPAASLSAGSTTKDKGKNTNPNFGKKVERKPEEKKKNP